MTLEETIQSAFDHYPSLFQTRESVLDQLFCTIGNGFDWVDGELVMEGDEPPVNPLENGKAKQHIVWTKKRQREDTYDFIVNTGRWKEAYSGSLKEGETLEDRFLSPQPDDNELAYDPTKKRFYSLCRKYSYLLNYPDDIKSDWLAGIKEMMEYVLTFPEDAAIEMFGKDGKVSIGLFREVPRSEVEALYNEKFGAEA